MSGPPAPRYPAVPWPAVNVALTVWLMLPEAPDPADLLEQLLHRPAWHADAACRGLGADAFVRGAWGSYDTVRALCVGCPVRAECLQAAPLADPEILGLWGGTTANQRRKMRRRGAVA